MTFTRPQYPTCYTCAREFTHICDADYCQHHSNNGHIIDCDTCRAEHARKFLALTSK